MAKLDVLTRAEWLKAAATCLGLDLDEGGKGALQIVDVRAKVIGDDDGDLVGFIGETLPVRVTVRAGADGAEREAALFMKTVPEGNPARVALAEGTRCFYKESGFYARVMPLLEAAFPGQRWSPRCLVARPRLLLYEDISGDFRSLGIRRYFDFDRAAVALDAVARLHAASLALEESDRAAGTLNERFADVAQEVFFTRDFVNYLSSYYVTNLACWRALVRLMPEYRDSPRLEEILKKMEDVIDIGFEIVKPSKKYRNVWCHGDLWVNNIMMKYDASGAPEDVRLVDYQLTRYCPPALDVESFLHLSTRRPLRDSRGDELRARYYASLKRELALAGLDIENLVPRADFDASCRLYGAFGRIVTATYSPGDLLPADVLRTYIDSPPDYERFLVEDRSDVVAKVFQEDEEYRDRLAEIMSELVEGIVFAEEAFI